MFLSVELTKKQDTFPYGGPTGRRSTRHLPSRPYKVPRTGLRLGRRCESHYYFLIDELEPPIDHV